MRWRKGLRNGDRENGGAWRGGWVEGQGTRDKGQGTRDKGQGTSDKGQGTSDKGQGTRDKGQAMESLGTEARGGIRMRLRLNQT